MNWQLIINTQIFSFCVFLLQQRPKTLIRRFLTHFCSTSAATNTSSILSERLSKHDQQHLLLCTGSTKKLGEKTTHLEKKNSRPESNSFLRFLFIILSYTNCYQPQFFNQNIPLLYITGNSSIILCFSQTKTTQQDPN